MDKILLCDDDEDISLVVEAILQPMDIQLSSVTRIDKIVELVVEIKPQLILMDLWVPDIGGENALIKLKKDPRTADLPILFFSAVENLKTISEKLGADGYIKKPFDVQLFRDTIKKHLAT